MAFGKHDFAPRRAPRRIGVESLEAKQLLAGDVSIDVVEGRLVVSGDDAANYLVIESGDSPGSYLVTGLPSADGEATTLNGGEDPVMVEGVEHGASIQLGDGDDVLRIHDAAFAGSVTIRTGGGDDAVGIGELPRPADAPPPDSTVDQPEEEASGNSERPRPNVAVRGNLMIATGEGDDRVALGGVHVGRNLAIHTGAGDDEVHVGMNPPPGTNPDGPPPTEGDAPPPVPNGAAPPAANGETPPPAPDGTAPAHHDGPAARNAVEGRVSIATGRGDDVVSIEALGRARDVVVVAGAGDDAVHLDGARVGRLRIAAGEGDDEVGVRHVEARAARIALGAGDDSAALGESKFGRLALSAGAGDDEAMFRDIAARQAQLSGGPGQDALTLAGENAFANLLIRGFEDLS